MFTVPHGSHSYVDNFGGIKTIENCIEVSLLQLQSAIFDFCFNINVFLTFLACKR